MTKFRPWTGARIAEFKRRYLSEEPVDQIAADFGLTRHSAYNQAVRLGVQRRGPNSPLPTDLTPEERKRYRYLQRKGGKRKDILALLYKERNE